MLVNDLAKDDFCVYVRRGVEGIIEKSANSEKLYLALLAISNGLRSYSDTILRKIYSQFTSEEEFTNCVTNNNYGLSSREGEVLRLIIGW